MYFIYYTTVINKNNMHNKRLQKYEGNYHYLLGNYVLYDNSTDESETKISIIIIFIVLKPFRYTKKS